MQNLHYMVLPFYNQVMVLYLQAFYTLARDIKLKMDKKLVSLCSKVKLIVLVLNNAISDELRIAKVFSQILCEQISMHGGH